MTFASIHKTGVFQGELPILPAPIPHGGLVTNTDPWALPGRAEPGCWGPEPVFVTRAPSDSPAPLLPSEGGEARALGQQLSLRFLVCK